MSVWECSGRHGRVDANEDTKLFEQTGADFSATTAYNPIVIRGTYKWTCMSRGWIMHNMLSKDGV